MEIKTLLSCIKDPLKYLTNKNKLNENKLMDLVGSKTTFNNKQEISKYIKDNYNEIFDIIREKSINEIKLAITNIDYDKFISRYINNDRKKEDFIYNTEFAINTYLINNVVKGEAISKKIKKLSPEIYNELYSSFEIYKENMTCHRQKIEEELIKLVPKNLIDLYPEARKIHRHFKIIAGPTNSGKTYEAMQELRNSYNGIYLGPLRLLAYEKYCELMEEGITASLITGEEEIINENSRVQCSTVEMCDLNKEYDCLVLDEAQLCLEKDRGFNWTKVILGSICKNIVICCAPEIIPLIENLITKCGDTFETIRKERLVPLNQESSVFYGSENGDAYIVFSRKNVHRLAQELKEKTKKKISILYGNLPYDVRQEEARKFNSGETELLVATDCIGMGLNLPIKRVVVMETEKFDGKDMRTLNASELKQIIGRAGRYNKYDEGLYTGLSLNKLKCILNKENEEEAVPYIDMPKYLLKINAPVKNIISVWNKYDIGQEFKKADTSNLLYLCSYADQKITDKKLLWNVINFKFDLKSDRVTRSEEEWRKMVNCLAEGKEYTYKKTKPVTLLEMEEEYKILDLQYQYYGLIRDTEKRKETIKTRNMLSNMIMKELETVKNSKRWFS